MAITRQWLETKPASTDKIKDGPTEFQTRWRDVRELLNSGGHVCDGVQALAEQGRHARLASGIASPNVFRADRITPILDYESDTSIKVDANLAMQVGRVITGIGSFDQTLLLDGAVQSVSPSGYMRLLDALRIYQADPISAVLGVKAGVVGGQIGFSTQRYAFFPGGTLTVGIAPLLQPSGGKHAHYTIAITIGGTDASPTTTLTAFKGAEVDIGSPAPNSVAIGSTDVPIAAVDMQSTSALFTILAASPNAFLFLDLRQMAIQSKG